MSAVTCRLGCLPLKINKCAFPPLESFEYCAFHIIPRQDAVASVAYTGCAREEALWTVSLAYLQQLLGLEVFQVGGELDTHRRSEHIPGFPRGSVGRTFVGILETQLKHVGYELHMLVYAFDKLLVEPLVSRSFQAGQVNALIEAFCIHARNLDEFFQGSGRAGTLQAKTFTDSRFKPRPNDKERKNLMSKISKQISRLTEQRTSVANEKISSTDRAMLYSILIAEADNFTCHLQPHFRPAWRYVPGTAAFGDE